MAVSFLFGYLFFISLFLYFRILDAICGAGIGGVLVTYPFTLADLT